MNTFTTTLFRGISFSRSGAVALGLTLFALLGSGGASWAQVFKATLAGGQEVPAVNTAATGTIEATLTGTQLVLTGTFSGLSSDLRYNEAGTMPFTHIHGAIAGQNGGILIDLMPTVDADKRGGTFTAASNTFTLTAEQVTALTQRRMYVNVHSLNFPGGELRGQLLPNADRYLSTKLSGLNEVPLNGSPGTGGALVEVVGSRVTVTGSFAGLSSDYTNAHLHIGAPGVSGGVKVPLTATLATDNRSGTFEAATNTSTTDLSADDLAALLAGNFYLNVHSATLPAGELRGQVLPVGNRFPTATAISNPAPGSTVTLAGSRDNMFQAEWTAATDPESNPVVYIWQLSATQNFAVSLINQNVGDSRVLAATYGALDDLLALAGVPVGGSVMLYHRALASDGSLITVPSTPAMVTITRGTVTGIREEIQRTFSYQVYPSPMATEGHVAVEAQKQAKGSLTVSDLLGRQVYRQDLTLQAGSNRYHLDLSKQGAGIYLVQVAVEGHPLPTRRILKR